jgi:hypothetical protein
MIRKGPIFTEGQLRELAHAARVPLTPAFTEVMRQALLSFLSRREARKRDQRQNWKPSLARSHLRAVAATAAKLVQLLTQIPHSGRLAIWHGAAEVVGSDLASGKLQRMGEQFVIRTNSPKLHDYEMDVTEFLLNPSDPYPVQVLSRAAERALVGPLVDMKHDPLAAVIMRVSRGPRLPLSATVSVESKRSARAGGQAQGRLIDLVVTLTRIAASLDLPGVGLPAPIAVSPHAVKKAIYERIKPRRN